jgi:CelD/BcsL family acetyltransferase involved in cellulose biosynthesis
MNTLIERQRHTALIFTLNAFESSICPTHSIRSGAMSRLDRGKSGGAMFLVDTLTAKRVRDGATTIRRAPRSLTNELVDIADIPDAAWRELAARAIEPNIFYEPLWLRAVSRYSRDYRNAKALLAWDGPQKGRLLGLMPVWTAWRALKLPVPMFVAWQPYVPLRTPLLDKTIPEAAANGLIDAAAAAGAQVLLMPMQTTNGLAFHSFRRALKQRGIAIEVHIRRERARLNATFDADTQLLGSLGAKKMKELKRQRNRLADQGPLSFEVAKSPAAVVPALEQFLALEASGWKGERGTALAQNPGDLAFIREAARGLASAAQFEVLTLRTPEKTVASCLVVRNGRHASFFKLAHDKSESKNSPGVQLTLDLTRHLCADTTIDEVDSTAEAKHPMIDHIWRDRLMLGDIFIPLTGQNFGTATIRCLVHARDALYSRARRVIHKLRAIRKKRK